VGVLGGPEVNDVARGYGVVIPFQIACGHCFMCEQGLQTQCETTQVREHGMGAALFGYTKLYGEVPGGQAEYLRVPQAQYTHIKVPEGPPDDRFVYLSDVLPTAWQAVRYAAVPAGGSLAVLGLGPIGDMCTRVARHQGIENVIGIDLVPERLERVRARGVTVLDLTRHGRDLAENVRGLTGGRGPDAVIDAVGMEAHGSPVSNTAQKAAALLPDRLATALSERVGVDSLGALYEAFRCVRRGGTVSIIGVYGGQADPFPMMDLFDKGVQLRMGQAHVRRWTDDILPVLLGDEDVLGTEDLCTHPLPLAEAPNGYEIFQKKQDGAIKVVLKPLLT
jgi:threonine dehydrogenase-like Zn-dependent dehydrogenase